MLFNEAAQALYMCHTWHMSPEGYVSVAVFTQNINMSLYQDAGNFGFDMFTTL